MNRQPATTSKPGLAADLRRIADAASLDHESRQAWAGNRRRHCQQAPTQHRGSSRGLVGLHADLNPCAPVHMSGKHAWLCRLTAALETTSLAALLAQGLLERLGLQAWQALAATSRACRQLLAGAQDVLRVLAQVSTVDSPLLTHRQSLELRVACCRHSCLAPCELHCMSPCTRSCATSPRCMRPSAEERRRGWWRAP